MSNHWPYNSIGTGNLLALQETNNGLLLALFSGHYQVAPTFNYKAVMSPSDDELSGAAGDDSKAKADYKNIFCD